MHQVLVEGLLLASIAGLCGLALAHWWFGSGLRQKFGAWYGAICAPVASGTVHPDGMPSQPCVFVPNM